MIEVRDVRKVYGHTTAVDDLTFDAPAGQVTALVGPHGAGKSTTMRLIVGLDAPDHGEVTIAGQAYCDLRRPLNHVGVSLDRDALHPGRTARNHLLWLARSHRIGTSRVDEVLEHVGLGELARRRAGELSVAARQRLGIAVALLGDPATIILDEPFDGLDPAGLEWVCELLRTSAAEGRTVLVASRLIAELDGTADRLVLVGRGRLIADTSASALVDQASDGRVQVRTDRRADALEALTGAAVTVASTDHDVLVVTGMTAPQVTAALESADVPTTEVSAHRACLVEAYMELTHDTDPTSEMETDMRNAPALPAQEATPTKVRPWVYWLVGGVVLFVVLLIAAYAFLLMKGPSEPAPASLVELSTGSTSDLADVATEQEADNA
ncbi:MAG: ATP-binding cassette domain-containing protein [Micrococcales bacterium]|nr:ATP-binding cassette domain-containing protein [Micrococcales bacterium]